MSLVEIGRFDRNEAHILIGSSISGGLLLNADQAAGSDFGIVDSTDPTPTPSPSQSPSPTPSPSPLPSPVEDETAGGRFEERYSGTINPGQPAVGIPFDLRRSSLDAQISQNHGNQSIVFELFDESGKLVSAAEGKKIQLEGLASGHFVFRVRGNVSVPVDFTIMSGQGR